MATAKQRADAVYQALQPRLNVPTDWARQNKPAPAAKYALLQIVRGPRAIGRTDDVKETNDLTRASNVRITPASPIVVGASYTVQINAVPFTHVAIGGDTPTSVSSALAALINADAMPVTAVGGAGFLDVGHDVVGTLFALVVTANLAGWTNNDLGHEVIMTVRGQREAWLQVTVISDEAEPPNDAATIADGAFDAIFLPATATILDAAGIAVVERSEMLHPPDIIGSRQRTRAVFEMRLRYTIAAEYDSGYVGSFEVDGDFEGAGNALDLVDKVFRE